MFTTQVRRVFEADDLALSFADWNLTGAGPDGEAIEMSGQTSDCCAGNQTEHGASSSITLSVAHTVSEVRGRLAPFWAAGRILLVAGPIRPTQRVADRGYGHSEPLKS